MGKSANRQLAAIMFTDIEGYTALMETDESAALTMRNRHREIFENVHEKYHGKIIQYFGDGTLSIFGSSNDAIDAAIEMQKVFTEDPKVPLRIGIHTGEVKLVDQDIIGDSVNVASRVESLGVAGSIFISDKVFDDIKNQKEIHTQSVGFYEFKNVEKPREIFAISNEGLVVPEQSEISGKTKIKPSSESEIADNTTLLKELWKRKVVHVTFGYLAGLWLLVQGTNYIINNFAASPYWTNVVIVFFVSFLPSVIIYSYHHTRLEITNLRLAEKITLPSNTLLSIFLIVFMFGNKDLGATTTTTFVIDEFGNKVEKQRVKSEFRRKVYVYTFENMSSDSTINWLGNGLSKMLGVDLSQDDYLYVGYRFNHTTIGSMSEDAVAANSPVFVTGNYDKKDSLYIVTARLYESESGRMLNESEWNGTDIFNLGDEITVQLKKDIGVPIHAIEGGKDLPNRSLFTDNLKAYEYFIAGNYEAADLEDPTFARSNLEKAQNLYRFQIQQSEAVKAISKAMEHRSRLSEIQNVQVRALSYNINGEPDKAIALIEMQSEMDPDDGDAYSNLVKEYTKNGYFEKALTAAERLMELHPEATNVDMTKASLLLLLNKPEDALALMNEYTKNFPKDVSGFEMAVSAHLDLGNLDQAEELLKKASLMNPEQSSYAKIEDHINYLKEKGNGVDPEVFRKYVGQYRYEYLELVTEVTYEEGKLYNKGLNQSKFRLYPSNDSTFHSFFGYNTTFIKNRDGIYTKLLSEQNGQRNNVYRIDSLVVEAEKQFSLGNDDEALALFKDVSIRLPEYEFVNKFINHLEYNLSKEGIEQLSNFEKFTGKYDLSEVGIAPEIYLDNGKLIIEPAKGGVTAELLQIGENIFITAGFGLSNVNFVVDTKGIVTGVEAKFQGRDFVMTKIE